MKLETGLPVRISPQLPIAPSDEDNIVRSVRHGLADVLAWLGEDVGPKPGAACHAISTPSALYVSQECFDELKKTATAQPKAA
jgi:hypothetical protein